MLKNWRISAFNGVLLAAYFIPSWTIIASRIIVSPIHGLYERPNISLALFISDHLHLAVATTVRLAWLLALGRLTVVAFLAIFLVLMARPSVRRTGGWEEALAIALAIGSLISFGGMVMASQVGENEAVRLHATELLMRRGTGILLLIEAPIRAQNAASSTASEAALGTSADTPA
jgi:hypothetical protein